MMYESFQSAVGLATLADLATVCGFLLSVVAMFWRPWR